VKREDLWLLLVVLAGIFLAAFLFAWLSRVT
jgi:hypothetical protein